MKWAVLKPVTLMTRPRILQVIRKMAVEVGMANQDLRVHLLVYLRGLHLVLPPNLRLMVPVRGATPARDPEMTNQTGEITR